MLRAGSPSKALCTVMTGQPEAGASLTQRCAACSHSRAAFSRCQLASCSLNASKAVRAESLFKTLDNVKSTINQTSAWPILRLILYSSRLKETLAEPRGAYQAFKALRSGSTWDMLYCMFTRDGDAAGAASGQGCQHRTCIILANFYHFSTTPSLWQRPPSAYIRLKDRKLAHNVDRPAAQTSAAYL